MVPGAYLFGLYLSIVSGRSKYALVVLLMIAFAQPAHAYIDPGSGSYLIQAILAGLLGILYFFKGIRTWIMSFFARLLGKGTDETSEE